MLIPTSLRAPLSYLLYMRTSFILLFSLFTGFSAATYAQVIDNTLAYKHIAASSYIRLNYENDFFSASDRYYTQGIHLEMVSPALRRFPLSKVLWHPVKGYTQYGIGLEHAGYTPTSISSDNILYGDRPFAAALLLKTFAVTTDTARRLRFSTALSTGVVGQAAGGAEMQTGIHRWLHNITPHGWQYQVHNDLIFNYQLGVEKQLLSWRNNLSLSADAMVRAGSLSTKASAGATLIVGIYNDPFRSGLDNTGFRIYGYIHPQIAAVGYDATMQGGLFNRTSPYTIAAADISRITFANRYGFVASFHHITLEYFQSLVTREFKNGLTQEWGGVQIAYDF